MSKKIQLLRIVTGSDNLINFLLKLMELYSRELSDINTKKINKNNENDLFIDAGLNMTSKKSKKSLLQE